LKIVEAVIDLPTTPRNICKYHALIRIPRYFPDLMEMTKNCSTWAIALEHLPGGTISRQIGFDSKPEERGKEPPYSDVEALYWLLDISRSLAYLHSRDPKVVHRDLKQDNLLLVQGEGRRVAKLADFGLHTVST
jgi:serine/threonine protein kinase